MTTADSFQDSTSQPDLAVSPTLDTRNRRTVERDQSGLVSTEHPPETAILVGVELDSAPGLLTIEDSLTELTLLAKTAGLNVIASMTQHLDSPNPATLIGKGKLDELKAGVAEMGANVVLFDDELSPRQQRELERTLGQETKVLDRTALILDIFARHARTREGAVQVELAQYEYRLPRLTRAWTHLARQAGGRVGGASGGVGVRGPGETQLEVDRREIGRRIAFLKRQLEQIRKHRRQHRRRRHHSALPVIALVGYTNAGKSTLLNALSGANVLAENQLFATLDPTTRRIELPSGASALVTDTVGFIQKLPTTLVAAFRATLEEMIEADVLVHVVDASHQNMDEQVAAVEEVLEELGAGQKTMVTALNKLDRLTIEPDSESTEEDSSEQPNATKRQLAAALNDYPNAVTFSALTGENLSALLQTIEQVLQRQLLPLNVLIPYSRGDLVAYFHQNGIVDEEAHTESGTHIVGRLPVEIAGKYTEFWYNNSEV
ncbi:GTPase HflX [Chloroflexi bacterium TSY]|nr:GTPase HflX [Chloroflexi bacterium TSY]